MIRKEFPAISESRPLRLLLFFMLYAAQGLPLGLFNFAVPGWLAASGASAAQVGAVLTASSLPWTLKFLNGFLMDRFAFLPMGRRRIWIAGGQAVLLVGLAVLALRDPGVGEVALIAGFAFTLNLAVNFQDVATDGMAADLVPEEERARTSGVMFGGQAIGIAATTALGGLLLAEFGMRGAALACAGYGAVVLAAVLLCRERPGERLVPWSKGEASAISKSAHVGAWGLVFSACLKAMATRESLLLVGAMLLFGLAWGLGLGIFPLLATQEAGMTQQQYSALAGSGGLAAGVLGLLVFGLVADLIGPLRLLRTAFACGALGAGTMLLVQAGWSSPWTVTLFVIGIMICRVMVLVPFGALAMGLCVPAVAATQMTLFGATGNLGMTLGSALLGVLDGLGGKPAIVGAMLVFFLAGLAFALAKRRDARASQPLAAA